MTVLFSKIVKTRKPHECFGCLREFPAGSQMHYSTIVDNGDIWSLHCCETCDGIMSEDKRGFLRDRDGYSEGFTRETLENGETPEDLLARLKMENTNRAKMPAW